MVRTFSIKDDSYIIHTCKSVKQHVLFQYIFLSITQLCIVIIENEKKKLCYEKQIVEFFFVFVVEASEVKIY